MTDINESDEHSELFAEALSALDKAQLPILGWDVFERIHPQHTATGEEPEVGERASYGVYHVLFPLTFTTSLRWLIKIPINGTADKWDDLSTSSLEADTKMIKESTSKLCLIDGLFIRIRPMILYTQVNRRLAIQRLGTPSCSSCIPRIMKLRKLGNYRC